MIKKHINIDTASVYLCILHLIELEYAIVITLWKFVSEIVTIRIVIYMI